MKEVVVCLEHRFFSHEGALYTKLAFPYAYWVDYLRFFDTVKIVARVMPVDALEPEMVRVDGAKVSYLPLPYYVGPGQFFRKFPVLLSTLFGVARHHRYFLLRSGNSSTLLWFFLMLLGRPYLREYPGNVKEGVIGFAGNSFKYRLLASFLHSLSRLQGRFSRANSFVSNYCRDLYGSERPGFVFSSFRASEIAVKKQNYAISSGTFNLVTVGRLENEKGHLLLLEAIHAIRHLGHVRLHLVGDGGRRMQLENYVRTHGLDVEFHGAVTDRDRLFGIVVASDVFVLPSLTEGMPRALLEAMTMALPCVSSAVGGVPEVLPQELMCTAGSQDELAALLEKILTSEALRRSAGERNAEFIAHHFSDQALAQQKISFWSKLYE